MNDDYVHSALTRWLSSVTGMKFIQAHQSGPSDDAALPLPYGVVNFLGSDQVRDNPQNLEWEDDGMTAQVAPVIELEWRFSVHVLGGAKPSNVLRRVRSATEVDQIREPLVPQLVFHELSQVRNIPEWINESWEPRAQMDIMLRGLTRDKFEVDVIEEHQFDISRI